MAPEPESKHSFWNTQPVYGTVDPSLSCVPGTVAKLPPEFEWCSVDIQDDRTVTELETFLANHYVEDDGGAFRMAFTASFLRWALAFPGTTPEWCVGVRVKETGGLVGFIAATPFRVRVDADVHDTSIANFLCVHKKLRNKRLAPVLIREILRRTKAMGYVRALYTGDSSTPGSIGEVPYHHRPLQMYPLLATEFYPKEADVSLRHLEKMYRLPYVARKDMRPCVPKDAPAIASFLAAHTSRARLTVVPTVAWVEHALCKTNAGIHARIRTDADGQVTDLWSYYVVPSRVLRPNAAGIDTLVEAFAYYVIGTTIDTYALFEDAMVHAKHEEKCDLFTSLGVWNYPSVLRMHKFGTGTASLCYHLYNWPSVSIDAADNAIVLW